MPDIFEYVLGLGTGAAIQMYKQKKLTKKEIVKELKEEIRKLEKLPSI